ncbi:unnamed protein product [Pieris brassicae]|uniref:Homeobox domain-containing protein n=1 Tax=Pieris brassicae TaxID=7116 RepID=A0A9P0TZJ7_PIEBR|nr:unnamed protein product [Pieris brassicae]
MRHSMCEKPVTRYPKVNRAFVELPADTCNAINLNNGGIVDELCVFNASQKTIISIVWFKNRRAKWRKQKREEQERLRKLQEERACGRALAQQRAHMSSPLRPPPAPPTPRSYSDESEDSDLEVA